MKTIKIDDEIAFTVSDNQLLLLAYQLEDFEEEIKRRMEYIIDNKCMAILKRLKDEWIESGKLAELGITSMPTTDEDLVSFIAALPEFRLRVEKEIDNITEILKTETNSERITSFENERLRLSEIATSQRTILNLN